MQTAQVILISFVTALLSGGLVSLLVSHWLDGRRRRIEMLEELATKLNVAARPVRAAHFHGNSLLEPDTRVAMGDCLDAMTEMAVRAATMRRYRKLGKALLDACTEFMQADRARDGQGLLKAILRGKALASFGLAAPKQVEDLVPGPEPTV